MEQKFGDYVKELRDRNDATSKALESGVFDSETRTAMVVSYNTTLRIIKDIEKILK